MNESRKQFVDKLLAADAPSLDARGRYEKEVRAMLQVSLTPRQRGMYLVTAVILMLPIAVLIMMSLFLDPQTPPAPVPVPVLRAFLKVYFGMTGLVLLFVAGILLMGYWRGVVNRRGIRGWAAGIGIAYVGLVGWMFMLMARDTSEVLRDDLRVFGVVLLVYAAVAWVRHRIARAEAVMTEKLLEIELRLAEIGEKQEAQARAANNTPPPE